MLSFRSASVKQSRFKMDFVKKVFADSEPEPEEEEEDLVDPQDELKEKCSDRKDCVAYKEKLDSCTARVESRTKTAETCLEELIDFMHCVDHCVSKSLFTKLK